MNQLLVGMLIVDNIKYMVDAPQRTCGYLCVINELCVLAGVQAQLNDVIISTMMPIINDIIRRIPTPPLQEETQEDDQEVYHHEVHEQEGAQHQQQEPDKLHRVEEYVVCMKNWVNEISLNFYADPLRFRTSFQTFYKDQTEHMLVQKLRESFPTFSSIKTYFMEQN